MPDRRPSRLARSVAALCLVLLAACGGDPSVVSWRDAELQLPEGWTVFEDEPSRLSVANVPLGAEISEDERPEGDVVAMFFTHEPRTQPGDWRRYLEDIDAMVEVDEATDVGGVPATRFEYRSPTADGAAETRELVVVIPAREVVVLAQPVPLPGDEDAPEVFERGRAAFESVLESISWGAPVEGPTAS